MTAEEVLLKIEKMNMEYIELKNSSEYKTGKDIVYLKNMIRKCKLHKVITKKINRKKVKKYNVHDQLENNYVYDFELEKNNVKPKIVIYTCVTGKYDNVLDPFFGFDNVEYVAFTDSTDFKSSIWKKRNIPDKIAQLKDNILINRYVKFHPKELFNNEEYDYSIYIDGNILVVSDLTSLTYGVNEKTGLAFHRHQFRNCIYNEIEVCRLIKKGNYKKLREQTDKYRKEGFPEGFGLYECNVIVSDLKNNNSCKILDEWWNDFYNAQSYRDQISLPYVIWKLGYKFDDVGSLGNNVYKNPKIRIVEHTKN